MKCTYCGVEISEGLIVCPNCGAAVSVNTYSNTQSVEEEPKQEIMNKINQIDLQAKKEYEKLDKASIFTCIISLFPIIGIIIFFSNRKDYPKKAKTAIICAAIGFVLPYVFYFIFGMISMAMQ